MKYFILISVSLCKNYNSLCKGIKIKECTRVNLSDEDLELVVEFSTTGSMIEGQEVPHLCHKHRSISLLLTLSAACALN